VFDPALWFLVTLADTGTFDQQLGGCSVHTLQAFNIRGNNTRPAQSRRQHELNHGQITLVPCNKAPGSRSTDPLMVEIDSSRQPCRYWLCGEAPSKQLYGFRMSMSNSMVSTSNIPRHFRLPHAQLSGEFTAIAQKLQEPQITSTTSGQYHVPHLPQRTEYIESHISRARQTSL
jgi:hypothetical protein